MTDTIEPTEMIEPEDLEFIQKLREVMQFIESLGFKPTAWGIIEDDEDEDGE